MIYALVDTKQTPGVVRFIATTDSPPGFLGDVVDVTNLNPAPQLGWTYDGTSFSEPVATVNRTALLSKAQTALTNNQAYLALATPTTTQAVAQVAALTRQVDALIRIVGQYLDSTQGT